MKTIVITGSTGFIGSALVGSLKKKYNIVLLIKDKRDTRKSKPIFNKNISYKYFKDNKQLNNTLKKIKADWLIHCATHYVKKHQPDDLVKLVNSNIEFGTILLDNLNIMGIKNFINFSTIWENYNGIKDNPHNLYSASKQAFEKIINYYQINNKNINFFNLIISDTYGFHDKREKIISVLKKNITQKKETIIVSKNLFLNLINIDDIVSGVFILLNKKINPGKYSMINKKFFNISSLINKIEEKIEIKIKWSSSRIIKEKIYNYKTLPHWKAKNSEMNNLVNFILKDEKLDLLNE